MSTVDRLLAVEGTRADALRVPELERPTRTSHDELAERAGFLRGATRHLLDDVADVHDRTIEIQLESRTDEAAKRSVQDLLDELADLGFAWRQIAQLVGVTVPAVRKWRQGDPASGSHRRDVARLLAFVDVLRSDHLVQDVPSWMEVPLAGSSITAVDVYSHGGARPLLLVAAGHLPTETMLDSFSPSWRDTRSDRFEIAAGSDGQPVIRVLGPEQMA
ncbi:MAG: hypothetical protein AB7V43_01840 [Acidimicrobiia bacterium]